MILFNNFTQNSAEVEGGALKYTSKRPQNITQNIYSRNSASYGHNIASYPVRIRIFNGSNIFPFDTLYSLINEVSNSEISHTLKFGLFDTDNQECILINTGYFFC